MNATSLYDNEDKWSVPYLASTPLIMVVEDDDDFRDFICSQLNRDHYQVVPMSDGSQAMAYIDGSIRNLSDHRFPDLLITDFRMPENDGLDVLAYAGFVPMILMTAFPTPALRKAAERLGAAYVFDKPFESDDLRTAVSVLVD